MNKLSKLEQLLKETNTKQEFNIVEDLKSLALSYGVVKSREFRKKLNALIAKYENDELTAIRQALIKKCQTGDTQAIKLCFLLVVHTDCHCCLCHKLIMFN